MKLLSVSFLASALCWTTAIAEPVNLIPRQATATTPTSTAPCTVKKVNKKLTWNFWLPPIHAMPRYVQYYDLVSYAAGYAWREANGGDPDDHVTKRIMFENDQGWTLINCTWKFPEGDPDRNACTSPDFGLLNTPGTNVGDAPPNKGKIGTLKDSTFPALSLWAVYDLLEFRLTPVVPTNFLKEQLNVEIFGWREDGSTTNNVNFKIKGSEVGYKVSLPNKWDRIVQWQLRISSGSNQSRQYFPFVIDDVIIDEYAVGFTDTDTHCLYPTQTPTSTAAAVTLKFDDIAASPTATLPASYKSYIFSSDWVVTKEQSYHSGSPGSHSASSNPNSLYSSNLVTSVNKIDADFVFDIDSFYITIDNTATSTQNPADLSLTVQGHGPCVADGSVAILVDPGTHYTINPTSYGFSVNLKAVGFRKQRGAAFDVYDNVAQKKVPFWIDDIVVRSWKDGLGSLPGCERCGGGTLTQPWGLRDFCEYPLQQR